MQLEERTYKVKMAIALLQDADATMQAALGAGDVCYDLHNAIEDIIETLEEEIA